jgi:hypothetical protein
VNAGRELQRDLINTTEEKSDMKNILFWGVIMCTPVKVVQYFTLLTPSSVLVVS